MSSSLKRKLVFSRLTSSNSIRKAIYVSYLTDPTQFPQEIEPEQMDDPLQLPTEIIELMNAFPFGLKDCPYNKSMFIPYIPLREKAIEIIDIYYSHVAWM